jgi:hypothetical protein
MFTNCVEREWRMVIRGIKIKKNKWEVQAPDAIRHFFASAHVVIGRPGQTGKAEAAGGRISAHPFPQRLLPFRLPITIETSM